MRFGQPWVRICMLAVVVAGLPLLGGCSGGGSATAAGRVTALETEAPVASPVFDRGQGALFALAQGESQVARIDPRSAEDGRAPTTLSEGLEGAGESLDVYSNTTGEDDVYLPQPGVGRVAVLDAGSLERTSTLEAGSSPARASVDVGSETLFTLSEDGSTATAVDLDTSEAFEEVEVEGGEGALIQGPRRGLDPHFWITGQGGTAYYKGTPAPIESSGRIDITGDALAVDNVKDTRAYVAEGDRLVAVELDRDREGLEVAAERSMGEPIRYIGVDEKRIYVATPSRLVVMEAENFVGLQGDFNVIETIDYRQPLQQEALRNAPLSGIAVNQGSDNVYLTLEEEPYILSIDKPDY